MKFVFQGNEDYIYKFKEIEIGEPKTVSEVVKILKRLLSCSNDIILSCGGVDLDYESGVPNEIIEVRSNISFCLNTQDLNHSSDVTRKKRKLEDEENKFNFTRTTNTRFSTYVKKSASSLKGYIIDFSPKKKGVLVFTNEIREVTQEIEMGKPTDRTPFETDNNIFDFFCKLLKVVGVVKLEKIIICLEILMDLLKIEPKSETILWLKSCIRFIEFVFEKLASTKHLKLLRKHIETVLGESNYFFSSVHRLDNSTEETIKGIMASQRIHDLLAYEFPQYMDTVESLLKKCWICNIPFLYTSESIEDDIIIFQLKNDRSAVSNYTEIMDQAGYTLILLNEVFSRLKQGSIGDYPELIIFKEYFRFIDNTLGNEIIDFLRSQAGDFNFGQDSNYKVQQDCIFLGKRRFEYQRDTIKQHQVKELLKSNNNISADALMSLSITSKPEHSKTYKIEIMSENMDNILISLLKYYCRNNKMRLVDKLSQLRMQISERLNDQIKLEFPARGDFMKQKISPSFDYGSGFIKIFEKFLTRLSELSYSLSGEPARDVKNFSSLWKKISCFGLSKLFLSFKNPGFLSAFTLYRFEMFDELLLQKSFTNDSKEYADYILSDSAELFNIEKNVKTFDKLGLKGIFKNSMQSKAIKKAYKRFLNFKEYDRIVEESLDRCFVLQMPKNSYGKTLLSLEIVLSNFSDYEETDDIYRAGIFFEYIREFSNYIQRCKLSTYEEIEDFNSPIEAAGNYSEAGYNIENKLFDSAETLYKGGAAFLLSIPREVKWFNFAAEFKKSNVATGNGLNLGRNRNDLLAKGEYLKLTGLCDLYKRKLIKRNLEKHFDEEQN